MDRRLIGTLLLVAVVLAGVVVRQVSGQAIGGSAVAASVPPAPQVGTCVTAISAAPDAGPERGQVEYPFGRFGSCAGPVIGEVMDVDRSFHPLNQATVDSYQEQSSLCELAEVPYVGSIGPFDPSTIATPGIGWIAEVTVESLSIGPTPLQRTAGQNWTACVGVTSDRRSYTGRLAGALTDGVLPPVFATCWDSLASADLAQAGGPSVACSSPHSVEALASTQISDATGRAPATGAQVTKSCLGMASRAMRTADPTLAGRIQVAAYLADGRLRPVVPATSVVGFVVCIASVRPPLRLDDTVIGIGDKPLPLAG